MYLQPTDTPSPHLPHTQTIVFHTVWFVRRLPPFIMISMVVLFFDVSLNAFMEDSLQLLGVGVKQALWEES